MSLQPEPTRSFEDWLEGERTDVEARSEYVDDKVDLTTT